VGLGLFTALLTCIEQIVAPTGYSSDDAGLFGAVLIGSGSGGAAVIGFILDYTHAYRTVLKGGFLLSGAGMTYFLLALRPEQYGVVMSAFALMGFFMMPLYPVVLETAVECTYPVREENSGGLLLLAGNILGMIFTFVIPALVRLEPIYKNNVFTPASWFIWSMLVTCCLVILLFQGEYKRHAHDAAQEGEETGSAPSLKQQGMNEPLLA